VRFDQDNECRTMNTAISFIKKNTVMAIALLAAVITSFIVPPDEKYLDYFDYKTLACLFSVLAVVCALKNVQFFYILACNIVKKFRNIRLCTVVLVWVTFIGSMLIANDMALLTFLPLGYYVLHTAGKERYMAFTFIMQNIAANLGGMLTPFGNPQNLYLYSKFNIPIGEFTLIMLPPFILAVAMITLCCIIFVKPEPIELKSAPEKIDRKRTAAYLFLFAIAIIIVFNFIPYLIGMIFITLTLIVMDRKALAAVDYPLLFTFVFFFIFAGNMARIDVIKNLFSSALQLNPLLFSVISCQFISNVPSAILLSQFTNDYHSLLLGVNIGGVGTLIASLASLITLSKYNSLCPGKTGRYIAEFSAFNFSFLIVLTLFCSFLV